jgi:hypothetical protein
MAELESFPLDLLAKEFTLGCAHTEGLPTGVLAQEVAAEVCL